MKKIIALLISVIIIVIMFFVLPTNKESTDSGVWKSAVYTEDTELGTGSKVVKVKVAAEEKEVTFTICTEKDTLADALFEHGLISGEEGAYGLYVKVVNGIGADYDVDKAYWSLTKNGEYMETGVSGVHIEDGDCYELTRTKQ